MATLLIDADVLIWRASSASQGQFRWGDGDHLSQSADLQQAIQRVQSDLQDFQFRLKAVEFIITLSDPKANWRKEVMPEYKMNRKGVEKPLVFWQLREFMEQTYRTEMRPTLEGDDVMGLFATSTQVLPGKKIIVSVDKDMQSVPGFLFNPNKPDRGVVKIDRESADRFHLMQTLTGDPVDGYKGCPGIGPKKAEKILGDATGKKAWEIIVRTYKKCGLNEHHALQNARVARILRVGEYTRERGVKLWNPPTE